MSTYQGVAQRGSGDVGVVSDSVQRTKDDEHRAQGDEVAVIGVELMHAHIHMFPGCGYILLDLGSQDHMR